MVSPRRATPKWRVLACSIVVSLASCESRGDAHIPKRIPADHKDCRNCVLAKGTCGLSVRYACDGDMCAREVPCDPECCDRFPIPGAVARIRPDAGLRIDPNFAEPREIARVPKGDLGLLVRVSDTSPIRLSTIGARPDACTGEAIEDLRGVELWITAEPGDLEPVSEACSAAVNALEITNDDRRDPPPEVVRYARRWISLYYPDLDPDFGSPMQAGRLFEVVVLPPDGELREHGGMTCWRLPGVLRPEVCSGHDSIVQRARAK
jgi:hypothetical protein